MLDQAIEFRAKMDNAVTFVTEEMGHAADEDLVFVIRARTHSDVCRLLCANGVLPQNGSRRLLNEFEQRHEISEE